MLRRDPAEPEVFTVREIARAADVPPADIQALIVGREAPLLEGGFVSFEDAVRLIQLIRGLKSRPRAGRLFGMAPPSTPRRGTPLLVSGALHGALIAVALALTGTGARTAATDHRVQEPARLVFIAAPGPGGGGGGGGLRQPAPPPPAQLKGRSPVTSPVSVPPNADRPQPEAQFARASQRLPEPRPAPEPLATAPAATPPVVAPVVSAAADANDEPGVVIESLAAVSSSGPGDGGGVGAARGGGTGEGNGDGIGVGSIAGTGGGPYRPGSGIAPPSLQREVKPTYTEEGRLRGVEGDVLLEVVVRADGTVGAVRIVRGLGAGLDQRAADAVRQWLFSPARRFGTPVDVLVEVAVEFRLR